MVILEKGHHHFIEQNQAHNPGRGGNPTVTRVVALDGDFIVEIYRPIKLSSIRVIDKTDGQELTFWEKLEAYGDMDLEEIMDMNLGSKELKEYLSQKRREYITKTKIKRGINRVKRDKNDKNRR